LFQNKQVIVLQTETGEKLGSVFLWYPHCKKVYPLSASAELTPNAELDLQSPALKRTFRATFITNGRRKQYSGKINLLK